MMLTHIHGQLMNMSNIATSMSISAHSVRHYLDILQGTFMIRVLQPWFEISPSDKLKLLKFISVTMEFC